MPASPRGKPRDASPLAVHKLLVRTVYYRHHLQMIYASNHRADSRKKLTFENKYDIIILLSGAHPHTGQAMGEGDILRDGKRPRNDQSIQPTDDPNTDTEKEKETDIDTRCLARRSAQRKSIFCSGKGRSTGTPPHLADSTVSWAWWRLAAPLLKKS